MHAILISVISVASSNVSEQNPTFTLLVCAKKELTFYGTPSIKI